MSSPWYHPAQSSEFKFVVTIRYLIIIIISVFCHFLLVIPSFACILFDHEFQSLEFPASRQTELMTILIKFGL